MLVKQSSISTGTLVIIIILSVMECNQVFDITYHDENISNVVQEHTKHHIKNRYGCF